MKLCPRQEVPRGCYYPQPDVDSTVVQLVRRGVWSAL